MSKHIRSDSDSHEDNSEHTGDVPPPLPSPLPSSSPSEPPEPREQPGSRPSRQYVTTLTRALVVGDRIIAKIATADRPFAVLSVNEIGHGYMRVHISMYHRCIEINNAGGHINMHLHNNWFTVTADNWPPINTDGPPPKSITVTAQRKNVHSQVVFAYMGNIRR